MRRAHGPAAFGVALLLIWLSGSSCPAQDSRPRPLQSVTTVYLRSDDVADDRITGDLAKAVDQRLSSVCSLKVLDLQSSFSPDARSAMKSDAIRRLLAFPELIAKTDRVRKQIATDGLLVCRVEQFGKYGKVFVVSTSTVFYDLREGDARTVDIGTVDYKGEVERKDLPLSAASAVVGALQAAAPGMRGPAQGGDDKQVVCNEQSRLFHAAECHHLPVGPASAGKLSRPDAVKKGYRPCPVCYPETRSRIDPESLEASLGAEVAGFVEYYYRRSNDSTLHARLSRVGQKIIEANGFCKRKYIFTVLDSDELNAFSAPGGYVYVTTGMLDAIESDDELASVLSHEIAHCEREHGVRQYRRDQRTAIIGAVVTVLSGGDMGMVSDFVRTLVMRGYDRRYETEADKYGYAYTCRTSYSPDAWFTLLGKLQDMELASNSQISGWLRTHPKAPDRIKCITDCKSCMADAAKYVSGLDEFDRGLASAVKSDEMRYLSDIDQLKSYVECVKSLP